MNFHFRYSGCSSVDGSQEAALSKSTQVILRNDEVCKPRPLFSILCPMDQNALNREKRATRKLQWVRKKNSPREACSL